MPSRDHLAATPALSDGGAEPLLSALLDALAKHYGNRFLLEPAPDNELSEHGMARQLDLDRDVSGQPVV